MAFFSHFHLVLDGHIQSLPVERFPAFEVNSSMTRLPSTLFFPVVVKHSSIHHQGGVNADKVRFLRYYFTSKIVSELDAVGLSQIL